MDLILVLSALFWSLWSLLSFLLSYFLTSRMVQGMRYLMNGNENNVKIDSVCTNVRYISTERGQNNYHSPSKIHIRKPASRRLLVQIKEQDRYTKTITSYS